MSATSVVDDQLAHDLAALRSTALRTLSAPLDTAVPIIGRWTAAVNDGPLPVFQISRRRPDVADLPRVLFTEGDGAARVSWRTLPGYGITRDRIVLEVSVARPVIAEFALAFTLPRDRQALDGVRAAGRLGLTADPRDAGPVAVLTVSSSWLARLLADLEV